ncbi:phosphatidylinositol-specific phospholipase C-like protein [Frankia torreyi]|uniref:1-phosphatidylinositol phosphodiesterase n=1 Tax=Frankia torreyi TaxID=1856 RepID=A0A0D8B4T7_9ACTN|nr:MULTISPECIES: phosphatidylinositol-specific phospholipase C [Frankia]KJE19288.1 phosphatidylinositol-specific phospholipase C-like protein [Frankia torreyi]
MASVHDDAETKLAEIATGPAGGPTDLPPAMTRPAPTEADLRPALSQAASFAPLRAEPREGVGRRLLRGRAKSAELLTSDEWMYYLSDSTSIGRISIPGTHESCARYGKGNIFVPCQTLDVADQLDLGCRFLDIRCRVVGSGSDRSFAIHHGAYYQSIMFGDVQQKCADFLSSHPSEFILMRVKQEYSNESDETFREIFNNRYLRSYYYTDGDIPTVGQARGKIVLLGDVAGLGGINYGGPDLVIQDDWGNSDPSVKFDEIWAQANASVVYREPGDDRLYVNYVSANDPPWIAPDGYADLIQPPLYDAIWGNIEQWRTVGQLGVMPLDFFDSDDGWNEGLISGIVYWNYNW